MELRTNSMVR